MRSQMEVMAFMERTVTCRVEKESSAPRGGPTAKLKVIHKEIKRYCQQWQRVVGDFRRRNAEGNRYPKFNHSNDE